MSVDEDIAGFNQGLSDIFQPKPIVHTPVKQIKDEEQKAPWQKKRTRRTHTDTYSMVCSYQHHDGDRAWLVAQLQTLPMNKREAAMMEYEQYFITAREQEPDTNRKDGKARRVANLWLVDLLEKINR